MSRKPAPFAVRSTWIGIWVLTMRGGRCGDPRDQWKGDFATQAEAIDYAYKNWPWYP